MIVHILQNNIKTDFEARSRRSQSLMHFLYHVKKIYLYIFRAIYISHSLWEKGINLFYYNIFGLLLVYYISRKF